MPGGADLLCVQGGVAEGGDFDDPFAVPPTGLAELEIVPWERAPIHCPPAIADTAMDVGGCA
jgi:hypothetical protein